MTIRKVSGQSNGEHQAAPVKTVHCSGTPYEIGLAHGSQAAPEIHRNVEIYTAYFRTRSGVSWEDARQTAVEDYLPSLEDIYPEIIEDMKGIADGAKRTLEGILALNLRSEILLTAYADGCTSLSQRTNSGTMLLSENWDWIHEVGETVVFLRITGAGSDAMTIHMLTEAGIVGKIGMNSAGVGICMNAIRCTLKDPARMPVHVMMRRILQYAHTFDEAKSTLDKYGLASSVNFMIADRSGNFGDFECTPIEIFLIQPVPSPEGPFVTHTNHLYSDVRNRVKDTPSKHSFTRQTRIVELTRADGERGQEASFDSIRARLSDEQGYPLSICRGRPDETMETHPTLACCMMDLTLGKARFLLGRPSEDVPIVEFEL
ncbi:acyl-coenzyme A:6-aminopenicillanic-acid-acyltransferase [Ilyonectria destructans]|nr:acyl-coenzyme A:6-aminopenicillanic-acid-acyltransferase [Ilyonectria destructans]